MSGWKSFSFARMDDRGRASLISGYRGKWVDGIPATSAPKSSLGPPFGANISTSSPFRLRHSTVFVSMVTMPSILGKTDSVIRAILILGAPLSGEIEKLQSL